MSSCSPSRRLAYIYRWPLLSRAVTPGPVDTALAGVGFDPQWVREDLRETITLAREHDYRLEIVLKDTHTCQHHPERFDQWAKIAREEVEAG